MSERSPWQEQIRKREKGSDHEWGKKFKEMRDKTKKQGLQGVLRDTEFPEKIESSAMTREMQVWQQQ